jgi:acyl transferase domain-containing protein/acyl-CoA synthetase (AMP-forming)/AMP-acid ligase II/pimeloyl-ACP methyl ester carboxylesterase
MLLPSCTFVDLLRDRAQTHPDRTAFIYLQEGEAETQRLTYAALDQQAQRIAAHLQERAAVGERVLLLYSPGLDFITAYFGCLYAGAIAVPAYPPRLNASLGRLQAIVEDSAAKLALTQSNLLNTVEGRLVTTAEATALDCLATDQLEPLIWQPYTPQSTDLAFLQYTSGSTGLPKGVMVSHGNLIHNSALIQLGFANDENIVGASWLPPYHDMGLIGGILQPLYVGAILVLMPPVAFLQRPYRWLAAISRYGVTTTGGPNFAYDLCSQQITEEQKATLDLRSWRLAFSGAEPVRAETLDRFATAFADTGFQRQAFYPCYGMAETTLIVSGSGPGDRPVELRVQPESLEQGQIQPVASGGRHLISCGQVLGDLQVVIVQPETASLCAEGEIGEIWVSGPSVAQGYWRKPELNQWAFAATLSTDPTTPFLRTGDLGFVQGQELFVTGRLKDLIIIRGRNHYPQDIERTVETSHVALRPGASAAFAVELDGQEQLVVVQEVLRTALRRLDPEPLFQAIRRAIAEEHGLQPAALVLLKTGSIPKTSSGKIQRFACRQGFLEESLNVVARWPAAVPSDGDEFPSTEVRSTPSLGQGPLTSRSAQIECWLTQQLATVLQLPVDQIDPETPFSSFGLDSLQAVQLSAQLEDWLGVPLAPTLIYDYPTIAALAAHLGAQTISSGLAEPEAPVLRQEAIAVIGVACRFPGADTPEAFWQLLSEGRDAIRRVPPERWIGQEWGGFLDQVDQFDPQFFGIAPREAQLMDPQQRLLLEVSWEALESAGLPAPQLAGSRTGVFVGISSSDYAQLQARQGLAPDAYSGTGNAHSIAANRLSYALDLRGPSLSIDTACSSSLVAVHLACNSLQQGECDQAIAAGVNLLISPELSQTFQQAGMLAADGRCKTFAAAADGYVRGEGCGVVILKRLAAAQWDGDPILAVIRGTAVNQDGRSNGLTAPNGRAQQAVIREALGRAGLGAAEIDYVEAHGTGTSLGDPIEVNALQSVLAQGRQQPCWVGSVKTNIGHLEAAAGIASLIKVVLALRQGSIPPHLNCETLNPYLQLGETLAIPRQPEAWPRQDGRRAGISSFGFGGTNAHVIIEAAAPTPPVEATPNRDFGILLLSARRSADLLVLAQRYADWLAQHPEVDWRDVCWSVNRGRSGLPEKRALPVRSTPDLLQALRSFAQQGSGGWASGRHSGPPPRLVLLFAGQGAQTAGMGQQLYATEPVFQTALDRCAVLLQPLLDRPLLEVLWQSTDQLHETVYTQPALFAVEYALAELWESWGLRAQAVMGHSVGEYVAACRAGVFSLEDGLRLLTARAHLMQALPTAGGMLAVLAPAEQLTPQLERYSSLAIAAFNGPVNTVLAGRKSELLEIAETLTNQGLICKPLRVSQACHSPLVEPMLESFRRVAASIQFQTPRIPVISNLTGTFATTELADPDYWVQHVRAPVQFAQGLHTLAEGGFDLALEISPRPTLSLLGAQALPEANLRWLPSLRPDHPEAESLQQALASLSVAGAEIDWTAYYGQRQWQELPTYPFQRQRYWFDRPDQPTVDSPIDSYSLTWQPLTVQPELKLLEGGTWLVCGDRQGIGKSLTKALQQHGQRVIFCSIGTELQRLSDCHWQIDPTDPQAWTALLSDLDSASLCGVIHSWSLDLSEVPDLSQQRQIYGSLLSLLKLLPETVRFWLLTAGAQTVSGQEQRLSVTQAPLWGFVRTLAAEKPQQFGAILDLDPDQLAAPDLTTLLTPVGEQLAWRQGRMYAARLSRGSLPVQSSPFTVSADGTYLITGGYGYLGRQLAAWLVQQGARQVVLVGRRPPTGAIAEALRALERPGVTLHCWTADVSQAEEVEEVMARLQADLPPLRGVIHAAGSLSDRLLEQLSLAEIEAVLAPKLLGGWNLHWATQALQLDFFLLFSSAATLLGAPAQANYAAANAALDTLAAYRRHQGLPALSLAWGPWADGGMAPRTSPLLRHLTALSPTTGLQWLQACLSQPLPPALGLFQVDWAGLARQFPRLLHSPYFAPLFERSSTATPESVPSAPIFAELKHLPVEQRQQHLQTYLQRAIAQILRLPATAIAPEENLIDLGMDSLMVMEAVERLSADLQLMLYPREVYERPRLAVLARYLAEEFSRTHDPSVANQASEPSVPLVLPTPKAATDLLVLPQRLPSAAFILSSPRSGSTLLRVMLSAHPQLFAPPELHLLPFTDLAQRRRELGDSHLGEGLVRAYMDLTGNSAEVAKQWVVALEQEATPVPEVYAKLQWLAGDRLLIDKSPSYASQAETLTRAEAWFENARYIHLVRHPYAVVESFSRMRMHKLVGYDQADPYAVAESIWAASNRNVLDLAAQVGPDRYRLMRYEDLVRDPEPLLHELCEFLGVPYDPAILAPYSQGKMTDGVHTTSLSLGDPNFLKHQGIDASLADRWREIQLSRPLSEDSQQLASQLGYELPQPVNPPLTPATTLPASELLDSQALAPDLNWPQMQEEFVQIRGLNLCLCQWGPESGPLVVCLHGILEQGTSWIEVARQLVARGYRILAPDLRGHGRSDHVGPGGSYHILDFLADLDTLVHRFIDRPFTLVGHSFGSVLGALLSSLRPQLVKRLILVETLLPPDPDTASVVDQLSTQLDYLTTPPAHPVFPDVATAIERLRRATPALSEPLARYLAQRLTEPCEGGLRWRWAPLLRARAGLLFNGLSKGQYLQVLRRIQVPITLVYGDRSGMNRPDDLATQQAAMPEAERVVLPGGHSLPIDAPSALADLIAL